MKRVAIIGASGYTGAELVRLVYSHPHLELGPLIGNSKAGRPVGEVLPNLMGRVGGEIQAFDADQVAADCELAFCALPHGASAGVVSELRDRGRIVLDLSADFRLTSREVYAQWYGEHQAPERFGEAAYGLVEWNRESLRNADLIAVPGCYPTSAVLALAPILEAGMIEAEGIVVDAKSGVSGAGRKPGAHAHFSEVSEGFRAYKAAGQHRHTPEIEQSLSLISGADVRVLFTPHLLPMTRGILSTCYARLKNDATAEEMTAVARAKYQNSPSVIVLDAGAHPSTQWVRRSNHAMVAYHDDPWTGRAIAFGAIDNLLKGAAGQAIQCANIRLGFEENAGIDALAAWP